MTPSGHNWVQGQGSGPRLKGDADEEAETFDAMVGLPNPPQSHSEDTY